MLQADEEAGHGSAVTGVVDSVQLDLTKQQVENLPPVKTDHPGG